jgi:putative aldouronate transport system permease protein
MNLLAARKKPLGAVSGFTNLILNICFFIFTLVCILPFILVIVLSFTSEDSIVTNGYSFFPEKLSLAAFSYLFKLGEQMFRSFATSIMVTVIGTVLGVLIMSMYAYVIFRKDFRFRKQLSFFAFFTMLFSGGLVPFYLVCTQLVDLRNSVWALILPSCVAPFYIIVLKTFFQTSVPDSIIESATIDGAGELRTIFRIVFPVALPGIATIALFLTLDYWNDWYNAMLFIRTEKLFPLQYLLMSIQDNMDFLMRNASRLNAQQSNAMRHMPNESARMAMVFISTIPITFSYPFFQRYFIQGLQVGSVKG